MSKLGLKVCGTCAYHNDGICERSRVGSGNNRSAVFTLAGSTCSREPSKWTPIADNSTSPNTPPKRVWETGIPASGFICGDCAREFGGTPPPGHVCTMHTGNCQVCGEEKNLCNIGDWNWPDGKARGMRD